MSETNVSLLTLLHALQAGTGQLNTINLRNRRVHVLEMEDVLFRLDSAVMMPDPVEGATGTTSDELVITGLAVLKTVIIRALEHPEQKLLIAGHTDTTGKQAYNFELSDFRAKAVLFLLEGTQREAWAEIADKKHHKDDVPQILKWASVARTWDCDPDEMTLKEAIEGFQKEYNNDVTLPSVIEEDGDMGPETWGAVFEVYQAELAALMDTDRAGLASFRSGLRFLDNARKAVGCGENWPIEEAEKDNYKSQKNRRLEFLFFDETESLVLDCHPSAQPCNKDLCPLYPPVEGTRVYLPVHTHPHPQSTPTFLTIEQPGATNFVRMHSLIAYMAQFSPATGVLERVQRFKIIDGKLCGFFSGKPLPLDCARDAFFYFSHRDDLLSLDRNRFFKQDGTGLPLLGPIQVPCGTGVEIRLNIWDQKDWVIVRGPRVDGERPDAVKMAEWRDDYTIGRAAMLTTGEQGFIPHGDSRLKEQQERWRGGDPIDLVHLGNPGTNPMWAGTLSALPSDKAKILLVANVPGGPLVVGSYQELRPNGDNQDLPGFHTYNQGLVQQLEALDASDQDTAAVDALPNPPARSILGDMCWQDQGQTNNCGPFSFSTAMNYWFPYTNNPAEKNGTLYAQAGNVDDTINGARTPRDIVKAAEKFKMNGRDNDAEELSKARALKLIKLWIHAGIPVLILVKEEYTISSYHWKTVAGYDSSRFFINNSGADLEIVISKRPTGVQFEQAPVGNDVDTHGVFFEKWKAAGGDIVDAFTSVDECTFIPLYPKDPMFASSVAR